MRISTTDPMAGNDVGDLEHALFVVEGSGTDALKIYFESEASKQAYLEFSDAAAESKVVDAYNEISGNETMGTIN